MAKLVERLTFLMEKVAHSDENTDLTKVEAKKDFRSSEVVMIFEELYKGEISLPTTQLISNDSMDGPSDLQIQRKNDMEQRTALLIFLFADLFKSTDQRPIINQVNNFILSFSFKEMTHSEIVPEDQMKLNQLGARLLSFIASEHFEYLKEDANIVYGRNS